MFRQHFTSDLRNEQIFRRRVYHLRTQSDQHVHRAPRRPDRSHGLHISQGDQVYFPQVWPLRDHPETRFVVRTAAEHSQREDIHIHMVLVSGTAFLAGPDGRPQVKKKLVN